MSELSHRDYYEKYWESGLGKWSPTGIRADSFEFGLLRNFIFKETRILDFGCGDGSHMKSCIDSIGPNYIGIDVSESAVELCRAQGLQALQYTPGTTLPFEEASFDVVTAFEVLEHVFDPQSSLEEIRRVLRPGGRLIGSVPNIANFGNRLLMVLGYFNPGGAPTTSLKRPWLDPHIRFFNTHSFRRLLSECQYNVQSIRGKQFSLCDLPRLYRTSGFMRRVLETLSGPIGTLGQWWPSMFSTKIYFIAEK